MLLSQTKLRPALTLLTLALTMLIATACLAPDTPMVLRTEGEAIEEGAVVEGTPGQEAVIAVEEGDAEALATVQPSEEGADDAAGEATDESAEEATPLPENVAEVPAEGEVSEGGLAAEIGFTNVLVSANYLVNRDVRDVEGNVIADVDDVLIDLNTGRILYIVVNYGDFLDLTDEDRPMPLSAFGWSQDLELVLRIPEETLDDVPAVSDEWPDLGDAAWNESTDTFWQGAGFASEFDAAGDNELVPARVTGVIGLHAGQLGEDLGTVEDMLLDLASGKVAYIGIFSTDDFYSPDLVLLVPLAAADLTVEAVDGDAFYGVTLLAVEPEILSAAPALDRSIFATVDFIDQSFTEQLNTYWSDQGVEVGVAE